MQLLLAALLAQRSAESPAVTLNWVSHSGNYALLGGGGFTNGSHVELTVGVSAADAVAAGCCSDPTTCCELTTCCAVSRSVTGALDVSDAALKFKVPDASKAYDVSVDGSAPLCLNLPDPWWWQGDVGNSSTAGGWLRVFGRSISNPGTRSASDPTTSADVTSTVDLKRELDELLAEGDFDGASELLARMQVEASVLRGVTAATKLRLTPKASGSPPILITATNASEYDAWFDLPASLPTGDYAAEITNGLSTTSCGTWQPLEMFLRPSPGPCGQPATAVKCDAQPYPCPGHQGRSFCKTNSSSRQCDSAPAPCPPCPTEEEEEDDDEEEEETPRLQLDTHAEGCPPEGCHSPCESGPAIPIHATVSIVKPYAWDQTVFTVACDWYVIVIVIVIDIVFEGSNSLRHDRTIAAMFFITNHTIFWDCFYQDTL
eukprot:COSAG06_NODE_1510_length_9237_cov_9.498140_5_plen_431_part_00